MNQDMRGKVVVITSATSGIGQVAAESLAGMGARIVQVARDRQRGEVALKRLQACAPGAAHAICYADLSRLSEMRGVATEIAGAEPHIDVLINNAGALFGSRRKRKMRSRRIVCGQKRPKLQACKSNCSGLELQWARMFRLVENAPNRASRGGFDRAEPAGSSFPP